ncbi:ROK family protein [Tamlana fucoidanivorans]|uniref:ROK family protein n=1 Tax=Allotamlana fucoidanivorans TaxID=2583814 RepID=A0A5C4SMA3_9FLAO|nr:ROK family protein [Tamlana fucoidanivorans]TNJ44891.1 ROK family protein [Tamlana fucoidanivorans]
MAYNIEQDERIVMTLDAGGTNFVFSAIQGKKQIVEPIRLYPNSENLTKCLQTVISGFEIVKSKLQEAPVAISFAFPGPADYPNGIIGDLPNLPSFKGGVPLGPMLEHHFDIPVYINNDGNLFAYGEALFGFLPDINKSLEAVGSPKCFKNLIGVTLGTGFGVGLVADNKLITGDNSNGGEGWLLRDILNPESNVEDHVSREGIRRSFAEKTGLDLEEVGTPQEIYDIATGKIEGNRNASLDAFQDFGAVLGEALSNIITLFDGIVVLGGGVSGAFELFAPAMFEQMESSFKTADGDFLDRLVPKVFNLEDAVGRTRLLEGKHKELKIPGTDKTTVYDPFLRTGVAVSKNSTSKIIGLGAYAFAINKLNDLTI